MRGLGRELGVEAMALYRYIPNYEALIDAVVNRVVDDLLNSPEMTASEDLGWREFLSCHAHGLRAMALDKPAVFPLVATHPPQAPWVRPPLRSLRWVEDFLVALLSRGFAEQGAIDAYRLFSSFLLGHLLLEVSALGVDTGPVAGPNPDDTAAAAAAAVDDDALRRYPVLTELAPELAEFHFAAEFDESLHNLIDRIGPGTARFG